MSTNIQFAQGRSQPTQTALSWSASITTPHLIRQYVQTKFSSLISSFSTQTVGYRIAVSLASSVASLAIVIYIVSKLGNLVARDKVYSFTVQTQEGPLFFRMERLTNKNVVYWEQYRELSMWVSGLRSRDMLSLFLKCAKKNVYPDYRSEEFDIPNSTGFTEREYKEFTDKITTLHNSQPGIDEAVFYEGAEVKGMDEIFYEGTEVKGMDKKKKYIAYVTCNPNFSIEETYVAYENTLGPQKGVVLNKFFQSYKDLFTCVACDFSDEKFLPQMLDTNHKKFGSTFIGEKSFYVSGAGRNPYWVLEQKYANLAILLQGFCANFAAQRFSHKTTMMIAPVSRGQEVTIQKSLEAGQGFFFTSGGQKKDLKDLQLPETDEMVSPMNFIQISALNEIFIRALSNT